MSLEQLHNEITGVTSITRENIHLLEQQHINLDKLSSAAESLRDETDRFTRVINETKWRMWCKKNIQKIKIALTLLTLLIVLIMLIVFSRFVY